MQQMNLQKFNMCKHKGTQEWKAYPPQLIQDLVLHIVLMAKKMKPILLRGTK